MLMSQMSLTSSCQGRGSGRLGERFGTLESHSYGARGVPCAPQVGRRIEPCGVRGKLSKVPTLLPTAPLAPVWLICCGDKDSSRLSSLVVDKPYLPSERSQGPLQNDSLRDPRRHICLNRDGSKILFLNFGRYTVPSPIPSCVAIFAQESPRARKRAIWARSTITRGRPSLLPFARAFRNPARTRSAIKLRSSSATAPRTVKTIRPAGVAVSSDSERLTNSIPMRHSDARITLGVYSHIIGDSQRDAVDKVGEILRPTAPKLRSCGEYIQ
jgi:hypothetical protein